MRYAKLLDNGAIEVVMCDGEEERKKYENLGFLPLVTSTQPTDLPGEVYVDSYSVKNGVLVQSWFSVVDKEEIKTRIQALKDDLSSTDYKVIKCYESSLIGSALPYDINQLHTARQKIRDEINTLELQL